MLHYPKPFSLHPRAKEECRLAPDTFQEFYLGGELPVACYVDDSSLTNSGKQLKYNGDLIWLTIPRGMRRLIGYPDKKADRDLVDFPADTPAKTARICLFHDPRPVQAESALAEARPFSGLDHFSEEKFVGSITPCLLPLTAHTTGNLLYTSWENPSPATWKYPTKDFNYIYPFEPGKTAFDYKYVLTMMPNRVGCYLVVDDELHDHLKGNPNGVLGTKELVYLDGPDIFIALPASL